ncbi:N-acetylneuraminate synthase family protein [Litoribrevibacter euphylliae]|uniref:N-acetylneuraminate synthase family protein n=1 Tax=Litoribrevibacter euphylliae TaxID=1834034 RepID=A0ABV7HF44_9GAMM
MNRIVCIIPARITSSRLPGKHLKLIGDATLIENQYTALINVFPNEVEIKYAIPDGKENDLLAMFLKSRTIPFYRGSEEDVFSRVLLGVDKDKHDWLIRINGDNVFIIDELIMAVLKEISDDQYDMVSNVSPRTYPKGCSIEAIRTSTFCCVNEKYDLSGDDREHVMTYFYRELDSSRIKNIALLNDYSNHSLSLDTFKDYRVVSRVIQKFGSKISECDLKSVCEEVKLFNSENPFAGKHGPFMIAEVGGNHEGDFEYAKRLVEEACLSDADCVKLQIYSPDLLVNKYLSPQRHKHFGKFALSTSQYKELLKIIRDSGKSVSASVWSIQELNEFIDEIDFIKVGSGDLTDALMLNAIRETGKPVIISTGLATIDNVAFAIRKLDPEGSRGDELGILQCTSMYPIPKFDANLNVMDTFGQAFPQYLIGYSDHTTDINALSYSVAAGAEILEFHFTDCKHDRDFRDHQVSLTLSDVEALVKNVIEIKSLQGVKEKQPAICEVVNGHVTSFRKGVFLNKDLKSGETIKYEDLITLRPCEGISALDSDKVVGLKLKADISAYCKLEWGFFE